MATPSNTPQRQNLETFALVWLDSLVHTSQENIDTKVLLRKVINRLKTFEDVEKCVEYIRTLSKERFVLIVSGRLGQEVLPYIHQYPQLIAVYVYCSDKKRNEHWSKNYTKVKAVIVKLEELIARIQTDQTKRNEYKIDQPLPITVFHTKPTHKYYSASNNDKFLYSQLLIDCMCRMKWTCNDKKELISLCKEEYKGNETELNTVCEFEEKYSSNRALWWFTRESFVCRMLNKAFQVSDIDLLFYFHFLIRDIRQQLKENKCSSPILTYRTQLMSIQELQVIKHAIGEFISINTFLPTIPNRERALSILENSDASEDMIRVLFEIEADPRLHGIKPISDISSLNYFTGVEVILFMAGSIFRPTDVRSENGVIIFQMDTCSDNDPSLKPILDNLKSECYEGETNIRSLGFILSKMKKFEDAERYYQRFLDEMPNDHHSVASCYEGLGSIALSNHDYDLSLDWYQKALEIYKHILRTDDPEIASAYSTIANIYVKKGEYSDALELYTKALQIWIRALGKEHTKVAICYKNMGLAYKNDNQHFKALNCYQAALAIRERHLAADHPEIAKMHNDIGNVYYDHNDAEKALQHYELCFDSLTKSYPIDHSDVLTTMRYIGLAYEKAGHYQQALSQFQKVAKVRRQRLSSTHPNTIQIEQDIKRAAARAK